VSAWPESLRRKMERGEVAREDEERDVFYIIKGAHLGEKLLSKRSPPDSVFSVR